jgi:hypothetical protein
MSATPLLMSSVYRFLRDAWIRTQRANCRDKIMRATNLPRSSPSYSSMCNILSRNCNTKPTNFMHGEGGLALVTTGAWFVVYSIPRVVGGGGGGGRGVK